MEPRVSLAAFLVGGSGVACAYGEGILPAFAANRQRLMEAAARFPKLRVLSDNYFVAGQAIALAKGDPPDPSRLGALNRLLSEVLSSDFVKTSINRAGLQGVDAAQPLRR